MVMLILAGVLIESLSAGIMVRRLLWPLSRLMFFIVIGLVVGQAIEALGWIRHFAKVAGPFFRFSKLGEPCSAAFTAAFVSGVASNAMLYGFYKDRIITKHQLFLANFVNHFPAYFLHLPTTFFIVVPLTGRAGLIYFILTFTALVLRTSLLFVYGHFAISSPSVVHEVNTDDVKAPLSKDIGTIVTGIKRKLPARLTNIAVYVIPIYILVFIVNQVGMFEAVNRFLSKYIVTTFMPMESLSVVVLGFTAEFTTGFATAGALLNEGILTIKQTALALLIGNIVAFPIRALRHQLPRYVGIFSPKMGLQILLTGQGLRVSSLILVGIVYYYITP